MISPEKFFNALQKNEVEYFTGVPDSLLKPFCSYVTDHTNEEKHVIAANEGASVAIALGYHLATNKVPLIYLQNSGLGNTINPLLSLADKEIYGTPMILMIGWRGQPGVKDEPQHVKQGEVTLPMLESMDIPYSVVGGKETNIEKVIDTAVSTAKIIPACTLSFLKKYF